MSNVTLPKRVERLVVRDGMVLTMDAHDTALARGSVVVEAGRIVYVGPTAALGEVGDATVIDANGKAILPGLVNAHTHLCMSFGRTAAVERRLLQWLELEMPIMRAMDAEGIYDAELLGLLENLKNGNTTVVDNIFSPRGGAIDHEEAAMQAMRDAGVRGVLARGYTGCNFDADFVESAESQERAVRVLHRRWHGCDGRLDLFLSPLLPWTLTPAQFAATRALCDELGLGLHMHVAESSEFNAMIGRHFDRPYRNVELLAAMGCLGPSVQAVAVADLDRDEIALLAETGTPVIFDPTTRLFWGTGFADIPAYLERGIVCGLATNGPAANCGQDLFESMKYACATAKTAAGRPDALTARRALRMATVEGAQAIGKGATIGSLEVGKRADLVTVDLRQPHLTPATDVAAALVYAARGSDIADVVVDGRVLLQDRAFVHIDEQAALRRIARSAERCLAAARIAA
jgi:5-methylthioadenosine/S-adenosylhomocysteine deaminase